VIVTVKKRPQEARDITKEFFIAEDLVTHELVALGHFHYLKEWRCKFNMDNGRCRYGGLDSRETTLRAMPESPKLPN
jgi:hypothetical protein